MKMSINLYRAFVVLIALERFEQSEDETDMFDVVSVYVHPLIPDDDKIIY